MSSLTRTRCFAVIASVFVLSRALLWTLGIRFDADPLTFYWQFVDPALLQHDYWRSLFYLEQQPPAFNAFLGAILHLLPAHPERGFLLVYFALGLVLSLALFALMDRMRVDRRVSLALALLFALSPSTILYENLLFYEYPLTTLLCLAALFLHRYASAGRLRDGAIFFSVLALISGIRSVYHLAWFAAILAFVLLAKRDRIRQTLRAAAIPTLLLLAFYAKHAILFHNLVPGSEIYKAISLSTLEPPPGALDRLIDSGQISPILKTDIFDLARDFETVSADDGLARISPPPAPTGIPVRDNCVKSTDEINWNCVWLADLAAVYEKDSMVVLRRYPMSYVRAVEGNVGRYFLPDTDGWPFDGRREYRNAEILARPLAASQFLARGSYVAFPVLFTFGLIAILRRRKNPDAGTITLAFLLGSIAYLTAVVLLLTYGDQNRIRTEISPYFTVLLGLFLTRVLVQPSDPVR
ncbi:MAG TPA: glycosyltransferase family 39 protein [Bryobacteraceae bacterium]|jgi:hypothetical protein